MSDDTDIIRIILILVAIVVIVPFLMMLFAWPMMGMWDGHMWDSAGGVGAWVVIWLLLLLVIVVGAVLFHRFSTGDDTASTDRAIEELRVAYARGELSDEEYEARLERLRDDD